VSALNQNTTVGSAAPVIAGETDTTDSFSGEVMSGSNGDVLSPLPDKPILRLVDADFKANCEVAEKILSPYVYSQGGSLVRIGTAYEVREDDTLTEDGRTVGQDGIRRNPGQRFLIQVSREYIERELSGLATIEKVMADGKVKPVSCPERIANNILRHGTPNFRPLAGIAHSPFLRADGSICDEPGYDAKSQTLYAPNADFPELPSTVTKEEAEDALAVLLAPFDEFPFATDAAQSAFIAHILTEAARPALDRVPIFFYTASYAGSGKSLLSEAPSMIVHGVEPALRDWVEPEEMRKTLFSSLVAGDRSIAFDNVPRGHRIRSAPLAKFVTQRFATERKLGETRNLSAINLATVSMTGNNLTPAGDIARRSLAIRLDADVPANELAQRVFKIKGPIRQYVLQHRVELMTAALTVLRGHQQSGHTSELPPLPSFESWSSVVRDALLWLGMADPLETQVAEADDETNHLEEAFKLLVQAFAGRDFAAADIAAHVNSMLGADGVLSGALIKAGCSEPHNSLKVGYWLRDKRDMFGAGHKLVRSNDGHKGDSSKWQLKPRASSSAAISLPSADNLDLVGG
jgi:putative DNA primase/helicase